MVDVLSVKAHAKQTMLAVLPPTADVLCTHPMFGPDSGRHGWQGLPCVYDQARAAPDAADCRGAVNGASGRRLLLRAGARRRLPPSRARARPLRRRRLPDGQAVVRGAGRLSIERAPCVLGCQMVKLSCERHDALAAASQFVTHLTGRLLSKLQLQPSPIATQGFKALLQLVDNTRAPPSLGLFCAREGRLFTAAGVWTGAATRSTSSTRSTRTTQTRTT